jgi:hypothetical protein
MLELKEKYRKYARPAKPRDPGPIVQETIQRIVHEWRCTPMGNSRESIRELIYSFLDQVDTDIYGRYCTGTLSVAEVESYIHNLSEIEKVCLAIIRAAPRVN